MERDRGLQSKEEVIGAVALLYWLPLLLLSAWAVWILPLGVSWSLFTAGLLLSSAGAVAFVALISGWEAKNLKPAPPPPPAAPEPAEPAAPDRGEELEEEIAALQKRVEAQEGELKERAREQERLKSEAEQTVRQLEAHRSKSEEALAYERNLAAQQEKSIEELNSTVAEKQQQNEKLESKIQDLTYEIKTLVQLADLGTSPQSHAAPEPLTDEFAASEAASAYQVDLNPLQMEPKAPEPPPASSDEEAAQQLKRCVNIAQKITSSHHLSGYPSRFRDFGMDNYSLDLRRLCDSLRSENGSAALVYSPKENKLLFANNPIKNLLGWSPEKFLQDFELIVQEGMEEWKSCIAHLGSAHQAKTRLVIKTRSGEDLLVCCQLGLIPTGVFRGNVVAILYTT